MNAPHGPRDIQKRGIIKTSKLSPKKVSFKVSTPPKKVSFGHKEKLSLQLSTIEETMKHLKVANELARMEAATMAKRLNGFGEDLEISAREIKDVTKALDTVRSDVGGLAKNLEFPVQIGSQLNQICEGTDAFMGNFMNLSLFE